MTLEKQESKTRSVICGDGLCPYVPCKDFPDCGHLEKQLEFERKEHDEKGGKVIGEEQNEQKTARKI